MLLQVSTGDQMARFSEATVGELVAERPARARVFERLGIDYCCGGKEPLEQACREAGLDYGAVTGELAVLDKVPARPQRNWAAASLTDLCDHIEQTHHAYLKSELPRLEMLTGKVAARHGKEIPNLIEVQRVVLELKAE